jgi:hypothetical protein
MSNCILGKPNSAGYSNHKYQWVKKYGPVPEEMVVMHSCPNKNCKNVDHLKLGTQSQNILEARDNGTLRPRGYDTLTERDREFILVAVKSHSYKEVAEFLGIHVSRIKHFMSGRTWNDS